MQTGKDNNTASVSGTVSIKSVVLIAALTALSSNVVPACVNRDAEIVSKLDRLETKFDTKLERLADRHSQLDARVARLEGARGASSQ